MADELKFGLGDLDISDDLDIALDNDTYQDQVNPAPPVAGNYRVKALSLDVSKYRKGENQGKPILIEGKYPIFVLAQVELVEGYVDAQGNAASRKVGLFADVGTKPFNRFGTPASGVGDLTRSYGTANWRGLDEGIAVLKEAFEQGALFTAQLDWQVYDSEFVAAAMEQLDLTKSTRESRQTDDAEKKLYNAVYRAARVTGMRNFPYNDATGRFSHMLQLENVTFKNPVTNVSSVIEVDHRALEARPTITRYFPATDYAAGRVKIGPLKVKAPSQVAA